MIASRKRSAGSSHMPAFNIRSKPARRCRVSGGNGSGKRSPMRLTSSSRRMPLRRLILPTGSVASKCGGVAASSMRLNVWSLGNAVPNGTQ